MKKHTILLAPISEGGNGAKPETAEQKIARLEKENTALKESQERSAQQRAKDENLIREKMASGLSRAQAEQVIAEQHKHDAWLADRQAKEAKAAKAAK